MPPSIKELMTIVHIQSVKLTDKIETDRETAREQEIKRRVGFNVSGEVIGMEKDVVHNSINYKDLTVVVCFCNLWVEGTFWGQLRSMGTFHLANISCLKFRKLSG